MKVQLFVPCFVDQLYANIAISTVKILEKLGCTVVFNDKQTCCGQPGYNAGYINEACKVSEKFVQDFEGVDYIVSPSGSCTGYLRNSLEEVLEKSPMLAKGKQTATRAYELTEFITDILKIDVWEHSSFKGKITYHDACGALRECNIKQSPRKLLSGIKDVEIVEMTESETCCGFGGTFAVKFEPISIGMAQAKVQNALNTNAEYIVSTDVSCLMHLEAYINKNNLPIKVKHIAEILAEGV